ncbi:hypothetical protein E2C01_064691 [Portunus trituberculatus]|uniref:Uncharacterized protein n=1 Tax=Portunus trituberculatus TaxID=210409 RepID=A0A5B7HGT2_PORTR|nr:hypothetical protein [Portunus trituberculatus]
MASCAPLPLHCYLAPTGKKLIRIPPTQASSPLQYHQRRYPNPPSPSTLPWPSTLHPQPFLLPPRSLTLPIPFLSPPHPTHFLVHAILPHPPRAPTLHRVCFPNTPFPSCLPRTCPPRSLATLELRASSHLHKLATSL